MGSIGPSEMLVIALVAVLLFGAGRVADLGKGLGQGIRNFKQGLRDEDEPSPKDRAPSRAGAEVALLGASGAGVPGGVSAPLAEFEREVAGRKR